MSTGELGPDLFPRQAVQTAMHQAADQLTTLNYLPARGSLALREALLRRLATWGVQTTPENILITSGSLQALQLITAALLEPGTTVYTAPASYLRSLRVLESVQAKWAPVPVDEQGLAYWQIPVSSQPQLLYTVPTFDNPLGTVMSAQRRQDLLAFAQKYQLPIIEDTAYQELWLDQRPPLPLKAHDTQGNVLYLGTVSKDLAPGLRVGWLVGPQAVVARLADVKMQMDYGASTLSQQTLVNLLTAPDYPQTLQRLRDQLRPAAGAARGGIGELSGHAGGLGDLAATRGRILPLGPVTRQGRFAPAVSSGTSPRRLGESGNGVRCADQCRPVIVRLRDAGRISPGGHGTGNADSRPIKSVT
ncbi:PLP-dependent aminotransferase family protein [Levilactobacillus zymae]|uniref:aminotransferase-like domain-containing protein n=1 Tax=Levilactobacillus zymae TaxID=267363 RepID=UPI003FCE5387